MIQTTIRRSLHRGAIAALGSLVALTGVGVSHAAAGGTMTLSQAVHDVSTFERGTSIDVSFKTVIAVTQGNVKLKNSTGEMTQQNFSGPASTSWTVTVDELRPGTAHQVWIGVPKMNRAGEWLYYVDPHETATRPRHVIVLVEDLTVLNDGDSADATDCGELKLTLTSEGVTSDETGMGVCDNDNNVRGPSDPLYLDDVTSSNAVVRIGIREDDNFPGSQDLWDESEGFVNLSLVPQHGDEAFWDTTWTMVTPLPGNGNVQAVAKLKYDVSYWGL